MSEYVTIWERVYFDKLGNATKWQRSYDRKNWEDVGWPHDTYPFVVIDLGRDIPEYVEQKLLKPKP